MVSDPYLSLCVSEQADDEEINKAYLRKVRQFPPERSPQTFEQIRAAYEAIKTQRDRLRYQLIQSEPPDLNSLLVSLFNSEPTTPGLPNEDLLLRALTDGLLKTDLK